MHKILYLLTPSFKQEEEFLKPDVFNKNLYFLYIHSLILDTEAKTKMLFITIC